MIPTPQSLTDFRAAQMQEPVAAAFQLPVAALQSKFGASLAAVLLYGSCRRQKDAAEGVVDLYVIVDDYASAYPGSWLRWLNKVLPPNVFYLEVPAGDSISRVKYALVSLADFQRGNREVFHSYFWARFCQPVALLHARDAQVSTGIAEGLAQAVLRFLREVAPMLEPQNFSAESIWVRGFQLTYSSELRPESADRAEVLVHQEAAYYRRVLELAVEAVAAIKPTTGNEFHVECSQASRIAGSRAWRWRRWQGIMLSVLRLAKASFTFSGGVDYAAWKVERHTGVHIEVTPRLRRFPLLFGWRVVWQLLRRGALH